MTQAWLSWQDVGKVCALGSLAMKPLGHQQAILFVRNQNSALHYH